MPVDRDVMFTVVSKGHSSSSPVRRAEQEIPLRANLKICLKDAGVRQLLRGWDLVKLPVPYLIQDGRERVSIIQSKTKKPD